MVTKLSKQCTQCNGYGYYEREGNHGRTHTTRCEHTDLELVRDLKRTLKEDKISYSIGLIIQDTIKFIEGLK